jgi:hypothetical protein
LQLFELLRGIGDQNHSRPNQRDHLFHHAEIIFSLFPNDLLLSLIAATICPVKFYLLLLILSFASAVSGQVPSRAIKVAQGYADFPENRLGKLTEIYFSGDWQELQRKTIETLQGFEFKPQLELDFHRNFYSIVFVYTAPDKKEEILRFLVHDPAIEPYGSRIPGIKAGEDEKLFEIFLTLEPDDALISTYVSTREKNPLSAQIPKFLKQFDPKDLIDLTQAAAPMKRIFAIASRIDLPYERAIIEVDDVVQKHKIVSAHTKWFNRPDTRFSFGLVSSVIVSSSLSDTRATIQSGDLAEDPLRGHMPIGILNIHPWPYDADADESSWSERFRLFVGGVLAPEFGLAGGAGLQLVRGFTINSGIAVLLIDVLKSGEVIGEEPRDPEDPFKYGTATVFFVGVGYNF